MRAAIIITLIMLFSFAAIKHNTYSYHTLNDPDGPSYNFHMLPGLPVDFRVDGGTLGGGDGQLIVQQACDEWDSLANIPNFCGNLTTGPDITGANFAATVLTNDGINDIVFDEDEQVLNFFGLDGIGVLGIGLTQTDATGQITDILIIINGTIPSSPAADLLATTIHEMGHTWGLAHTVIGGVTTADATPDGLDAIDPIATPTMNPFSLPVNDEFGRTLETDDIASTLLLYGP